MPKKKTEETPTYYDIEPIMSIDATYRIIYGQRGNGKTFAVCRKIIDYYIDHGIPSAYIRRLDEMIKPSNLQDLFSPHIEYIAEKTGKPWNSIYYRAKAFYFAAYKDGKLIQRDQTPFCRAYAINTAETTKGQDAGEIKYILFDEFITRSFYINNEFILYQNLLSSLIRSRSGVEIIMVANSVNKYSCPYFKEMGLNRVKDQKQGTIDVYTAGKTQTRIAVEYSDDLKGTVSAKAEEYFCFDNPELKMITSGAWEMSLYRHIPPGINKMFPELVFIIKHDKCMLLGELYIYENAPLLTFTRKTTEIKDPENTIIYSDDISDNNPLHQTDFNIITTRAHEIIRSLITQHKTYFGTNDDGELFSNWLRSSKTQRGVRV